MGRLLPVNDAAIALGVSVVTLKRHLKSGKVSGHQEKTPSGFRWYVEMPDAGETGAESGETTGSTGTSTSRDQVIDVLQQQVKELWDEVAARRQEVRELHILLQQSQAQIPIPVSAPIYQLGGQQGDVAESAVATSADTADATAKLQKGAWWQFWR